MNVRFRPLISWPAEFPSGGSWHDPFTAGFNSTLTLLEFELSKLDAHEVVIEAFFAESDLRLDGWPRAHANPSLPGVIVSFDSKHGPLRYGTQRYPSWQANLRAIALGLEALRAVDRHGIGKRGEQYTGWKQLGSGGDEVQRGRDLIAEYGGVAQALKATHPDRGGDEEAFRAVQAARKSAVVT